MNKKIGICASAVNMAAVLVFAVSMPAGAIFWSYLASVIIAFSFAAMVCAFFSSSREDSKAAGLCALVFGTMYAGCNSIVYFTQITTVRNSLLTGQALSLLDYQSFGLMFNLDMLGYCLMAISTFFLGLTIVTATAADKWLKGLLLVHGVFAISCFVIPILGLFSSQGKDLSWVGIAVLEFWCIYFLPVGLLSVLHFSRKP